MRFPRGKGFDLACGIVVTVFLDDFIPLTGIFLGNVHDPHQHNKDFHEFILIQLTCPFRARGGAMISVDTLCAINVMQIMFIVPGKKSHHHKWHEGMHDCCCHDKHHDKDPGDDCHDMADDDDFDVWDDKCAEKHIINIKCGRAEGKQRVININCDDDNTVAEESAGNDDQS